MHDEQREAFERFCREEYPHIVRTAYLITGDREEALDVAQEVFIRAYERWRFVSKMNRSGGWASRVAANLAISWRRRQRLRRRHDDGGSDAVLAALDPEPRDDDVMAALATLTPAQRAVVVLRFFADQSV